MGPHDTGARRRPAKAATLAALVDLDMLPYALMVAVVALFALAIGLVAQMMLSRVALADDAFQPGEYELARLRAGQSWDSGAMSVAELRPGGVDRALLQIYVTAMGKSADLTLAAAAGPNLVSNSGQLLMQTASAIWGEPGIIPRSHLGSDGVWEFPRLPDQDERDLLIGQRWRVVENVESQILFLGPDRRFGWDDFADLVNPLQHIPLVNLAYRAMTGDQIYGAGRLMDLGFGPVAGASTVFELAYQSTTGQDLEYQAVAAVFGPAPDNETAALASDDRQVADLRDLRRGSNQ
jgi:hypothetical protein